MAREKMERARSTITHQFVINGPEGRMGGTLHFGLYPDGRIGELFITIAKEGSTVRGMADMLAKAVSHALQNGTPVEEITHMMIDTQFPPYGATDDPDIPTCKSLTDYIGRRMAVLPQGEPPA